jgi:hypothetical protein
MMGIEKLLAIGTGIIAIAAIAVLVQSPYTSQVISSTGNAFSSSLKVAMGSAGR